MTRNSREFFRVFFKKPITGEILRKGMDSLAVDIENISAGGLAFVSPENVLVGDTVECSFNILDNGFLLEGMIVRKSKIADHFEYGVGFTVDQGTSSELFKELNYYQIRLRKGTLVEE